MACKISTVYYTGRVKKHLKKAFTGFVGRLPAAGSDERRSAWILIVAALAFLVGIAFAKHLWIADRLYPLDPFFHFLSALPRWLDHVLLSVLIISLVLVILYPKARTPLIAALAIAAFMFLEDRQRLFPSFFEYFMLLLLLSFRFQKGNDEHSRRVLDACRLALAFIYVWSGLQKAHPSFEGQIAWVLQPVTKALPFLQGAFIHWAAVIVPYAEAAIGIELLFKKTRTFAMWEAILMHVSLLLLIGPLRGNWNDSAWAWNLASLFFVYVLFHKSKSSTARDIAWNKRFTPYWIALAGLGLLPALSFANAWYSALSFNVYSGNVVSASYVMSDAAVRKLPLALDSYVRLSLDPASGNYFDVYKWSEDEFNALPYPETQAFRNLGRYLCGYATRPSDVVFAIRDKLRLYEDPARARVAYYDCADLGR